jgi:hypothetical protein
MRNQIDEMLNSMGEQKEQGGKQNFAGRAQGGPDGKMIDEKPVAEMHAAGAETYGSESQITQQHNQGHTEKLIDELQLQPDEMSPQEFNAVSEADIDAVLGGVEGEVDEAMGIAHSSSRHNPGDHLPGKDFAPYRHKREGSVNNPSNESVDKKVGSLIEENKKLTKKVNETVKFKKSATTLIESYKSALEKYRNQLKEMAVFNTNLAHVNNLLVNEELALTQEDKIKIINEFKKVDSIADSQKKYKTFLTEMKDGKKTLTESVEAKVTTSVASSSKQKLDEVVEKTAYADDKHIQKMRKLIEYVEKRGKRIIE